MTFFCHWVRRFSVERSRQFSVEDRRLSWPGQERNRYGRIATSWTIVTLQAVGGGGRSKFATEPASRHISIRRRQVARVLETSGASFGHVCHGHYVSCRRTSGEWGAHYEQQQQQQQRDRADCLRVAYTVPRQSFRHGHWLARITFPHFPRSRPNCMYLDLPSRLGVTNWCIGLSAYRPAIGTLEIYEITNIPKIWHHLQRVYFRLRKVY